jgi:hypothetical protein
MVLGTNLSEKEFLVKYLPCGFILDDRLYTLLTRPDVIKGAINFKFRSTDVVVSSYPKSGFYRCLKKKLKHQNIS